MRVTTADEVRRQLIPKKGKGKVRDCNQEN